MSFLHCLNCYHSTNHRRKSLALAKRDTRQTINHQIQNPLSSGTNSSLNKYGPPRTKKKTPKLNKPRIITKSNKFSPWPFPAGHRQQSSTRWRAGRREERENLLSTPTKQPPPIIYISLHTPKYTRTSPPYRPSWESVWPSLSFFFGKTLFRYRTSICIVRGWICILAHSVCSSWGVSFFVYFQVYVQYWTNTIGHLVINRDDYF